MKHLLLLALAGCLSMQAAIIQLKDGEVSPAPDTDGAVSNSNPRVWDLGGGLTMTVRAFSLSTNGQTIFSASTTQFGNGQYGLGVCAPDDACDFNEWQVDNNNSDNFVLFTFSAPVDIAKVTIRQSTQSYDSDTSWYAQAAAASSPLLAWFNQNVVNGPTMNPDSVRDVMIGATGVQTLLFGAPSNMGNNDYFKIWTIDATAASTVPEPGSLALLGSGLVGLGIFARRRSSK